MAIVETGSAKVGYASTATVINITHGLTINAGDVVVAIISVNNNGNTIIDDNGADAFVEQIQEDHPTGTARYAIYSRVAGASEPARYDFSCNDNANRTIVLRVFSGVHADVWDVAPAVAGRD